jgi:hypothetical protein
MEEKPHQSILIAQHQVLERSAISRRHPQHQLHIGVGKILIP